MKNNVPYYAKNIQTLVQTIEEVGEEMNPYFQKVRQSIDSNKLEELKPEELSEIHQVFTKGVARYEALLPVITAVRPPARILGMNKRLESTFKKYIASCQKMTAAVENKVDLTLFNESEKEQDELTDDLTFCIQRISLLLSGK